MGVENPIRHINVKSLSDKELGFLAEYTPTGMPINVAKIKLLHIKRSVAGILSRIRVNTGVS